MRILLIEDDAKKAAQIGAFLARVRPAAVLEERRSFQSGLKQLISVPPGIVLLDMTMPTYDISPTEGGGRPRSFGGREIMAEMHRRGLKAPAIVVTGFDAFGEGTARLTLDELRLRLREEYPTIYVGAVHYDASSARWQEELRRLIGKAEERISTGEQ